MLGSPILYLKAMRILMFQLSGFYCTTKGTLSEPRLRDLHLQGHGPGHYIYAHYYAMTMATSMASTKS